MVKSEGPNGASSQQQRTGTSAEVNGSQTAPEPVDMRNQQICKVVMLDGAEFELGIEVR